MIVFFTNYTHDSYREKVLPDQMTFSSLERQ